MYVFVMQRMTERDAPCMTLCGGDWATAAAPGYHPWGFLGPYRVPGGGNEFLYREPDERGPSGTT